MSVAESPSSGIGGGGVGGGGWGGVKVQYMSKLNIFQPHRGAKKPFNARSSFNRTTITNVKTNIKGEVGAVKLVKARQ